MLYQDWLRGFSKNKKLVAQFDQSATDAVHDVCRYMDSNGKLWETAITYTGRLVLREGKLGDDGVTITWNSWQTKHEVEVPKLKKY